MVKVKTQPKRRTHSREMIHKPSIRKAMQKGSDSGSELLNVKRQSSIAKLKRLMTGLKKKEKMVVKRNYLHRKIKKIKNAQLAVVAKEKQPIVHDMKPLLDALPTEKEMDVQKKESSALTSKQSHQQFMDNLNIFKQVLLDPDYTKDPLQAISAHVTNMVQVQAKTLRP